MQCSVVRKHVMNLSASSVISSLSSLQRCLFVIPYVYIATRSQPSLSNSKRNLHGWLYQLSQCQTDILPVQTCEPLRRASLAPNQSVAPLCPVSLTSCTAQSGFCPHTHLMFSLQDDESACRGCLYYWSSRVNVRLFRECESTRANSRTSMSAW